MRKSRSPGRRCAGRRPARSPGSGRKPPAPPIPSRSGPCAPGWRTPRRAPCCSTARPRSTWTPTRAAAAWPKRRAWPPNTCTCCWTPRRFRSRPSSGSRRCCWAGWPACRCRPPWRCPRRCRAWRPCRTCACRRYRRPSGPPTACCAPPCSSTTTACATAGRTTRAACWSRTAAGGCCCTGNWPPRCRPAGPCRRWGWSTTARAATTCCRPRRARVSRPGSTGPPAISRRCAQPAACCRSTAICTDSCSRPTRWTCAWCRPAAKPWRSTAAPPIALRRRPGSTCRWASRSTACGRTCCPGCPNCWPSCSPPPTAPTCPNGSGARGRTAVSCGCRRPRSSPGCRP